MMKRATHLALTFVAALALAACGGGDSDSPTNPPVAQAPAITTGPVASTVNSGATATFSVAATGSSLAYQWRVNGADIAGATAATYTTPALTVADSGKSYTVVVSNSAGSATSTAAVLTVNGAAAAAIELNQQSANKLVADVNAGVAQLQQADAVGGLPFGAQIMALPIGATVNQSIACSTIGTGGSGAINYSMTYNESTGQPVSVNYTYDNCSFTSAGFSYAFNGSGAMSYSNWVDQSNYSFTISYNLTYSFVSAGYTDSGTVNSTESCTFIAGAANCSLRIGSNDVRDVQITSQGSVTTVQTGRISNSEIDCVYSGWVYDSSIGRATSGTVTVTAPNGDRAVITATSTGYTVAITVSGVSQTFIVTFSS